MLTRRHFLQISALTAAGYAMAAEPTLAQAIQTDTTGLVAGDVSIKSGNDTIRAYQTHPEKSGRYPVSATAAYARGQPVALSERVGVTGFCWGGSTTI